MKPQAQNKSLLIVALLCVVAVIFMIFSLSFAKETNRTDFVPPPFDEQAVVGIPEVPDEFGWSEVNAVVYKFFVCGELKPQQNELDVWLTNPKNNSVWLKLRILDDNEMIIGESGLIKPGEYIPSVILNQVPESGTDVTLKIMGYEPETYHSAGAVTLNTIIQ